MALKDLVIPSIKVPVPDGEDLVVRGLALDSIIHLLRVQGGALQEMYASVTAGDVNAFDVNELAVAMLDLAPELVGHVVACSVGEPDQWAKVMALPAPVQLELLETAGTLTFAVEGGPKKVMETVIRLMGGLTNSLDSQIASATGSGVSDER